MKIFNLELLVKSLIYLAGICVMSFGIALTIQAGIGVAPWDVLHIGLYKQFGLTIGTWNIIVGIIILAASAVIVKKFPKPGAYFNLIFVGVFIDLFLFLLPFSPSFFITKIIVLIAGLIIMATGMGMYISAGVGTGPRDSLMMALHLKKGWKVQNVRLVMEISVLVAGWLMGGPVHIGTVIAGLLTGHASGISISYFYKHTNRLINVIQKYEKKKEQMKGNKKEIVM